MTEGQFALVPIEAIQDKRLTLEQTRVLIALFSFRNKVTDTVWPSRAAIAERTGMHPSNISAATTALVALGWLEKVGSGGHSKASRYTLRSPEAAARTIACSATVAGPTTVARSATVAEAATVAQSATRTVARSATPPVAESARGKEQTIEQTTEQTIPGPAAAAPRAVPKKPIKAKKAAAAEAEEAALQAACRATWAAYSVAYEQRYGAKPVRNASVNAKVRQFVQRIGHDESPAVAQFFVERIADSFVVRKVHDVGQLLSGAEGYRTQWAAGTVAATAPAFPNRQEALEQRNRSVAQSWASQGDQHAAI